MLKKKKKKKKTVCGKKSFSLLEGALFKPFEHTLTFFSIIFLIHFSTFIEKKKCLKAITSVSPGSQTGGGQAEGKFLTTCTENALLKTCLSRQYIYKCFFLLLSYIVGRYRLYNYLNCLNCNTRSDMGS